MNNNDNHNQKFFCTSKRSMSLISAALVLIFFLAFMTGYVWGKRVALEDILKALEQKTFADQISGSLYALSSHDFEVKKEDLVDSDLVVVSSVVEEGAQNALEKNTLDSALVVEDISQEKNIIALNPLPESENAKEVNGNRYYAPLIGFSSKKAADKFVALLKYSPLEVSIKERTSAGIHGKKKVWYQVVTQQYTDKEELESLVAHVVKKEHLSGVRVLAC